MSLTGKPFYRPEYLLPHFRFITKGSGPGLDFLGMFRGHGSGPGLLAGVAAYHANKERKRRQSDRENGPTRRVGSQGEIARRERQASQRSFPTPVASMKSGSCRPPEMAYPDAPVRSDPPYAAAYSSEGPSDADGPFTPPAQDWRPGPGIVPFGEACRAKRSGSTVDAPPDYYAGAAARPPPAPRPPPL